MADSRPSAAASSAAELPERFEDLIDEVHVLRLPMVTRFRGITEREIALLPGPDGWAEFSPFTEYGTEEASRWLRAALEFAGLLPGDRASRPTAGSAAEEEPQTVAVNATLPACPAEEVESVLARYGHVGTVKAKVAEHGIDSLADDLARLRQFRRILPDTTLRLDANAGYSLAEAQRACTEFADFDLQYFEQPVAGVEDMARLREELADRDLPIVLAADESIRKAEDPLRVAALGAAEVIIVKVQPLGGIAAGRSVIDACGLPAVVSSALESSVGLAAGARLAAQLPRTDRSRALLGDSPACGLGTVRLFASDVVADDAGMRPVDGFVPVTRIAPDPDRLQSLAVDPGRFDWWARRLQQCWSRLRLGERERGEGAG
ncbi:o-succinylbenzoate synthase [Brevibacterium sp. SMBL_HHYL_HB1]|uniref:o-succinylbenzoate synthase n=1 Tax=Brevibacterium sp. SMBL_HHYL_HB1 TaxID=2777556 RepID=UPI001BAD496E|nr:o-succinylbenzoate synthase [Brevibacterium sp. SMBL_HHYL_HB1]QUL78098.1 o-succinylbenzoate synthase [Brevibacterium sp. SMBL_HHYL_HB1]